MKVTLVWGGWSCMAGYIHWAYVAESSGEGIFGKRMFEPPNRTEVSNPKNCDYGKPPKPYPKSLCEKWIEDNQHELIDVVKLRTD